MERTFTGVNKFVMFLLCKHVRLTCVLNKLMLMMMTGTVCFEEKKLLFVMQNLGIWGLTGTGVKMRGRKCHIWNRRPWFTYSLCNFYGATMMIKGNLLLSAPIVKHFGRRWSDSSWFSVHSCKAPYSYNKCSNCSLSALTQTHNRFATRLLPCR